MVGIGWIAIDDSNILPSSAIEVAVAVAERPDEGVDIGTTVGLVGSSTSENVVNPVVAFDVVSGRTALELVVA